MRLTGHRQRRRELACFWEFRIPLSPPPPSLSLSCSLCVALFLLFSHPAGVDVSFSVSFFLFFSLSLPLDGTRHRLVIRPVINRRAVEREFPCALVIPLFVSLPLFFRVFIILFSVRLWRNLGETSSLVPFVVAHGEMHLPTRLDSAITQKSYHAANLFPREKNYHQTVMTH